jgi:hypothetical protein
VKKKIILDLCGGTGSWSKPYREAGYDVRLITLPEHDVLNYVPPKNVYGILAAPPCTEFSLGKNSRERNMDLPFKIVFACLRIIAQSRPDFYCIENPRGLLRQFFGEPDAKIQHWQFGTLTVKHTDLWGIFNSPAPIITEKPKIKTVHRNSIDYLNPKCPVEYKGMGLKRADLRAITPPGFALAFFKANP